MLLGLRKIEGVKINDFKSKFVKNPIYLFRNELKRLSDEKLITVDSNTIRLTSKGINLANLVWEEFIWNECYVQNEILSWHNVENMREYKHWN